MINFPGHNSTRGFNQDESYDEHNPTFFLRFELSKEIIKTQRYLRDHVDILEECLRIKPDAKLGDLCAYVQRETGVRVGTTTMSRMVRRLGLPYKKNGNQGRPARL